MKTKHDVIGGLDGFFLKQLRHRHYNICVDVFL